MAHAYLGRAYPMPYSPSRTSLTVSTSWLIAAKTLAFAFTLATPLLLVRRMPVSEFGLYKQIFLIINSAVTMLPLGFGLSAFYFLPRETDRRRQVVFNVVLLTGLVATVFAVGLTMFPGLLLLLFQEPAAVPFAPWIGVIVVLWVIGSFFEIVTVANDEVGVATLAIMGNQLTRAALLLSAAIVSGTIRSLAIAAVIHSALLVIVLLIYLEKRFPGFWHAFNWSFLRQQVAYSLPFGAAALLFWLQADLHNYFVSHHFGAATFAIYAVGCFQLPLFNILGESVGSVLIPRISLLQHQQQTREILLLCARAMRKLAAVYFPAYAFLMIMRREFIVGLFTKSYVESIPLFAVNLTIIPLAVLLTDPIMRAYAEHRHFLVKLHGGILAGLTIALWLSIARFGLMSAITLVVLSVAIGRIATTAKIVSILHVRPRDLLLFSDIAKIAGAAAVAALITLPVRTLLSGVAPLMSLALCSVWFGCLYAAAVVGAGLITPEEREAILAAFTRVTAGVVTRWPTATSVARD